MLSHYNSFSFSLSFFFITYCKFLGSAWGSLMTTVMICLCHFLINIIEF